ncbi:MAG: ABC transporter permease [Candidatus Woesearchaeota archaeon]
MHSFKTSFSVLKISFKEALAYRMSMMFSLVSFPILLLVQYFIWTAIFNATGSNVIAGFTLEQMIGYYVIGFITLVLIWTPVADDLHEGVREGSFIKFLTKPMGYIYYSFLASVGGRFLALLIEFIPLLFIMGFLIGKEFVMTSNLMLYLITVMFAFVINYQLTLIIGCLIFFLTNPNGVTWVYRIIRYVLAGGLIPITFFPEIFQKIIIMTPFPFINFIPASIFVGNTSFSIIELNTLNVALIGLLQISILSIIILLIWKISLKRFQGVGA